MIEQARRPSRRIRVRRVLVLEGPEFWVRQTLERSFVQPDKPYLCIGTIRETERVDMPIVEEAGETDAGL